MFKKENVNKPDAPVRLSTGIYLTIIPQNIIQDHRFSFEVAYQHYTYLPHPPNCKTTFKLLKKTSNLHTMSYTRSSNGRIDPEQPQLIPEQKTTPQSALPTHTPPHLLPPLIPYIYSMPIASRIFLPENHLQQPGTIHRRPTIVKNLNPI